MLYCVLADALLVIHYLRSTRWLALFLALMVGLVTLASSGMGFPHRVFSMDLPFNPLGKAAARAGW